MSKSFTGALKKVVINKFTKVNVPKTDLKDNDYPLGSISLGYTPLGYFADDVRQSLARAIALHDNYMSAECDAVSDYCDAMPSFSYYVSSVQFVVDANDTGRPTTTTIPLVIAPDIAAHVEYTQGGTTTSIAGVRGLFCRYAIIVKAGTNINEFRDTLRHEMGHALVHVMSHLKDDMYGADEVVQMEEICMHMLSDHFDKLCKLNSISYKVEQEHTATQSSRKWLTSHYWSNNVKSVSVSVCKLSDLTINNSSVESKSSVQLDSNDLSANTRHVADAVEYYSKYFNVSGIGHSAVRAKRKVNHKDKGDNCNYGKEKSIRPNK
jgi:hypothetical protein